jgi:hypothetical protein
MSRRVISILLLTASLAITAVPNRANADGWSVFVPDPIASEPQWAATLLFGVSAGDDRLLEILSAPWSAHLRQDYFIGGALSRRLGRFFDHFMIEAEIGQGGRPGETNSYEVWGALFLRYDGFFWNNILYTTIAVSTGVNYMTALPLAETHEPKSAHLLHYLAPEITFALPEYRNHELVFRYHHRSGVFGLFSNVWGGSNVITGGYRYRF